MKRIAVVCAFACALLAMPALAAEDFSGKWVGTFSGLDPNGQPMTENVVINLVHKGKDLTGTAGPSQERQWPVTNGKVDGDNISFAVQGDSNGPLLRFTLAFAEGHLKGDVNAEKEGMKLSAKADLTRAK